MSTDPTPVANTDNLPDRRYHVALTATVLASAFAAFSPSKWLFLVAISIGAVALVTGWTGRDRASVIRVLLALAAVAYPVWLTLKATDRKVAALRDQAVITELVAAEERILALTPDLKSLAKDLLDLHLPSPKNRPLFAPEVDLTTADGTSTRTAEPHPLAALLADVDYFEHAKLYFVEAHFDAEPYDTLHATNGLAALARLRDGSWADIHGKILTTWEPFPGPEPDTPPTWKITAWKTVELHTEGSPQRLFTESLDTVVRSTSDVEKIRRSHHQEASIAYYRSNKTELPHPFFAPISANQKPGIAVADIDSDGDDDIYVTVRMGNNLLLENNGDGTFTENAALHGLHFTGHATCALFADFDNDGDPDLLLGRSLRPSLLFTNENGYFHANENAPPLPFLAISASAADVNSDGLLDFYLCTYRPATLGDADSPSGGDGGVSPTWPDSFLDPPTASEYYRRHERFKTANPSGLPRLLDQLGPPNVLYLNRGGGRFEPAPHNTQVGLWKNSLQATFADYDNDGDPDLYVANDWSPDNLYRNDGADGFTDVTREAGTTAFGFAMGASFGDYDGDGLQDLYVSNMFSKAGNRIIARLPEIEPAYLESAAGNYLYRQSAPGRFELVSGLEPPALQVARGGWGWGGQFFDFDNDTDLDIYSLAGYFTAPDALRSDVDL